MSTLAEAFRNLRYFLQKNGVEPDQVKVTIEVKNVEELMKFHHGVHDGFDPLTFSPPNGPVGVNKLLGIKFEAKVAEPPKDGKDFSVDTAWVEMPTPYELSEAMTHCITSLAREGAAVKSMRFIARTDYGPFRPIKFILHAYGKRI